MSVLWFLPLLKILLVGAEDPGALQGFRLEPVYFRAALLGCFMIAVAIAICAQVVRAVDDKRMRMVGAFIFIVATIQLTRRLRKYGIVPIGYIAGWFSPHMSFVAFATLVVILFSAAAFVFVRYFWQIVTATRVTLLFLFPFALLVLGQLAWRAFPAPAAVTRSRDVKTAASRARVVVLLFDELDQRALSEMRPAWLRTPNFDVLAKESFVGTSARAPGHNTDVVVPSLLSGSVVKQTEWPAQGQFRVWFADSMGSRSWYARPHLFEELTAAGRRVAVVGWYHSYCRDVARIVARCWTYNSTLLPAPDLGAVVLGLHVIAVNYGLDHAFSVLASDRHAGLRKHALEAAADPGMDLVYLHFSIPHSPFFQYARGNGYFGGVQLADATVGEIRDTLIKARLWDRTVLVVLSDHGTADSSLDASTPSRSTVRSDQVPFYLRFPVHPDPVAYHGMFNTIVFYKLIPALMDGELHDAKEMPSWLARQERT